MRKQYLILGIINTDNCTSQIKRTCEVFCENFIYKAIWRQRGSFLKFFEGLAEVACVLEADGG